MDKKGIISAPGAHDHVIDEKFPIVAGAIDLNDYGKICDEQDKKEAKTYKSKIPKHGLAYIAKPEHKSNPLLGWDRNDECFCGSHKKFKKCHLNKLERAVHESLIPVINGFIKTFRSGAECPPLEVHPLYLMPEFRGGKNADIGYSTKDEGADRTGVHIPPAEGRVREGALPASEGQLQEVGVPSGGASSAEPGVVGGPVEAGRGIDGGSGGDRPKPGLMRKIAGMFGIR